MKKTLISVAAILGCAGAASGTVWTLQANLDGLQEVPPSPSPGLGFVELTLDDVTGQVVLTSGSFSGLLSNATASHIHGLAPVGVNAGVLIGLNVPSAMSGSITGSGTLTPANVTGMLAGLTYVNLHSAQFPGGEIRGQLTVIPAPASMALLGMGGLVAMRRRR